MFWFINTCTTIKIACVSIGGIKEKCFVLELYNNIYIYYIDCVYDNYNIYAKEIIIGSQSLNACACHKHFLSHILDFWQHPSPGLEPKCSFYQLGNSRFSLCLSWPMYGSPSAYNSSSLLLPIALYEITADYHLGLLSDIAYYILWIREPVTTKVSNCSLNQL